MVASQRPSRVDPPTWEAEHKGPFALQAVAARQHQGAQSCGQHPQEPAARGPAPWLLRPPAQHRMRRCMPHWGGTRPSLCPAHPPWQHSQQQDGEVHAIHALLQCVQNLSVGVDASVRGRGKAARCARSNGTGSRSMQFSYKGQDGPCVPCPGVQPGHPTNLLRTLFSARTPGATGSQSAPDSSQ